MNFGYCAFMRKISEGAGHCRERINERIVDKGYARVARFLPDNPRVVRRLEGVPTEK